VQSLIIEIVAHLDEYGNLTLQTLHVSASDYKLLVVEGIELLEVVQSHF
jgi:hypothetical protein